MAPVVRRTAVVAGLVAALVGFVAMAWGTFYQWPDYVHTDYGFPFVWGTHTVDTLIGPVDQWQVSNVGLLLDLVFWVIVVALVVGLVWAREGRVPKDNPAALPPQNA